MEASEMTNEELANYLESITPDFEAYTSPVSEYFREAAVRLRKSDDAVKDAMATCTDEKCPFDFPEMRKTNAELHRHLKVAEDALAKMSAIACAHCDLRDACQEGEDGMVVPCNDMIAIRNALAAIRQGGDAK